MVSLLGFLRSFFIIYLFQLDKEYKYLFQIYSHDFQEGIKKFRIMWRAKALKTIGPDTISSYLCNIIIKFTLDFKKKFLINQGCLPLLKIHAFNGKKEITLYVSLY